MIRISTTIKNNHKVLLVGASAGVIASRQFGLHSSRKLSTICEENGQKQVVKSTVIPPRSEYVTQLTSKQFDVLIVGGGATGCKVEFYNSVLFHFHYVHCKKLILYFFIFFVPN
jgi:hypothetical protein